MSLGRYDLLDRMRPHPIHGKDEVSIGYVTHLVLKPCGLTKGIELFHNIVYTNFEH